MRHTDLTLPVTILKSILAVNSRTHMRVSSGDTTYIRYWPCGCKATYCTDEAAAADWQPCDTHLGWAVDH